jgi:hypothetical protein
VTGDNKSDITSPSDVQNQINNAKSISFETSTTDPTTTTPTSMFIDTRLGENQEDKDYNDIVPLKITCIAALCGGRK